MLNRLEKASNNHSRWVKIKGSLVLSAALFIVALTVNVSSADEPVKVDPAIPGYTKTSGVSGNINSVGSDTMNNLMTLWCEGFTKDYPNVKCQIEGKGSSTAPPALIEGTAQFGPMSRDMKSKEVDEFEKAFGYPPTEVPSAIDTLAVFVNKDNPIDSISSVPASPKIRILWSCSATMLQVKRATTPDSNSMQATEKSAA